MSLLSIATEVCDEIGIIAPPKLVGNADPDARRILACARRGAEALYRAHNWSILAREHEFETEADERNYPVPDDFGRFVTRTAWDRTSYWRMRGSLTPQQWQHQRSAIIAPAGLLRHFRQLIGPLAGSILIDPVPATTGDELVYEYVSSFWAENVDQEGQGVWLADTDEFRLDHELFTLELRWRIKAANGQPYSDERADAEGAIYKAKVADIGMEAFSLTSVPDPLLPNIPEANWPTE